MKTLTIIYSLTDDVNTFITTTDDPKGKTIAFKDIGEAIMHVHHEYAAQDLDVRDFTVTFEPETACFIAEATIPESDDQEAL